VLEAFFEEAFLVAVFFATCLPAEVATGFADRTVFVFAAPADFFVEVTFFPPLAIFESPVACVLEAYRA
jgi:hypothetical protein